MHPVWMAGQLVIIQLRGHTSATSRLQSGRARPPSGLLRSAAEGFPVAARSTFLLLATFPRRSFFISLSPSCSHKATRAHAHMYILFSSFPICLFLSIYPRVFRPHLPFSLLLFATSTPPAATLNRESSSRESEALWYIGRTHCTGWNAICPPRKAITIRSRENCPISNDTNGRISGNLYLVASPASSHPPFPSVHTPTFVLFSEPGVWVVEIELALETSRHTAPNGSGYKRAGNSPRRARKFGEDIG